jgi:dTDP-4-amino-4,6-dideoxygalactose transaminase
MKFLAEQGVDTKIHYPVPIHLQKAAAYLGYKKGDFPMTEKQCETILSLPVYPQLSDEEVNYVIEKINLFYKK